MESLILGVEIKPLVSHQDSRGFFREIVRSSDPFFAEGFGQWSHSKMAFNTVKAWHFHHLQIDWWYVPMGGAQVVLFDNRVESPTYQKKLEIVLGEPEDCKGAETKVVRIPQGVLHACKVLTPLAHLFYITSRTYDSNDEGRLPFNTPEVPHDWGNEADLIVAERDRKLFIPPYARKEIA